MFPPPFPRFARSISLYVDRFPYAEQVLPQHVLKRRVLRLCPLVTYSAFSSCDEVMIWPGRSPRDGQVDETIVVFAQGGPCCAEVAVQRGRGQDAQVEGEEGDHGEAAEPGYAEELQVDQRFSIIVWIGRSAKRTVSCASFVGSEITAFTNHFHAACGENCMLAHR